QHAHNKRFRTLDFHFEFGLEHALDILLGTFSKVCPACTGRFPPGRRNQQIRVLLERLSMRIPSSVFAVGRYVLAFSVIAGSLALMSAPTKKSQFTKRDKAFYADPNVVAF